MMTKMIARFGKDESGVTAVEYGVLAFALVTAIALVTEGYGSALSAAFGRVAAAVAT